MTHTRHPTLPYKTPKIPQNQLSLIALYAVSAFFQKNIDQQFQEAVVASFLPCYLKVITTGNGANLATANILWHNHGINDAHSTDLITIALINPNQKY